MDTLQLSFGAQETAVLLDWFRHYARDLPWRKTDDPYQIWISEIMLQQTRVAAVLGYFARFLTAFPTVETLSAAPEDQLMKLWEGLGYYSRARNLQKCARILTDQYGGQFPADYNALLTLPGIGEYTAGAIASAAFGLRVPAVDGNVLRVVTRLADCHDDIGNPKTRKAVRDWVQAVMPERAEEIRRFNQALMEVGAIICIPNGSPQCGICPLSNCCRALTRGTANALPVKAPKKARRIEEKTVFLLLQNDGTVALRKRPKTGLLAGLWEFPNVDGALKEVSASETIASWGLTPVDWQKRLTAKHIFTHVEWHMTGYVLKVTGSSPDTFLWLNRSELDAHAVPSAFAAFYREAHRLLDTPDSSASPQLMLELDQNL